MVCLEAGSLYGWGMGQLKPSVVIFTPPLDQPIKKMACADYHFLLMTGLYLLVLMICCLCTYHMHREWRRRGVELETTKGRPVD